MGRGDSIDKLRKQGSVDPADVKLDEKPMPDVKVYIREYRI